MAGGSLGRPEAQSGSPNHHLLRLKMVWTMGVHFRKWAKKEQQAVSKLIK
jgi:hypothetical protein